MKMRVASGTCTCMFMYITLQYFIYSKAKYMYIPDIRQALECFSCACKHFKHMLQKLQVLEVVLQALQYILPQSRTCTCTCTYLNYYLAVLQVYIHVHVYLTISFLSKGANSNRVTVNNDHTVLSLACAGGHLNIVQYLLMQGVDSAHVLKVYKCTYSMYMYILSVST